MQCGVRVRFRCSRDDATLSQRPLLSGTPTAVHANSFPSGRVLWDTVSGMYRMHTISTDAHWAGLHYTSARAGMHCQQTAQPLILSTRSRHSREDAIHAANFFSRSGHGRELQRNGYFAWTADAGRGHPHHKSHKRAELLQPGPGRCGEPWKPWSRPGTHRHLGVNTTDAPPQQACAPKQKSQIRHWNSDPDLDAFKGPYVCCSALT